MTTPAEQFESAVQQHVAEHVFGAELLVHGICLALVAGGHVLLEGVPGVGKTLLARTLATYRGGRFKRIQCTADLMPSDITGIHVFDADTRRFDLVPGPLFADVVLVDEVNRTGPKTQSALLEAMEEGTVTIDRETYPLPEGFFVLASQNPHEFEGTYPLPESQLDRFLLRFEVGYPAVATERQILQTYDARLGRRASPDDAPPLDPALVEGAREQAAEARIADSIYDYVVALAGASRDHPHVSLGLSPRATLALMRCARVEAAFRGLDYVTPDHIKAVARAVMTHRLILSPDATLDGIAATAVVDGLLESVPVPRG